MIFFYVTWLRLHGALYFLLKPNSNINESDQDRSRTPANATYVSW